MAQRQIPPELRSPFLEAKVQMPAVADTIVRRPRLLEQLDAGDDCELTVVSGPPGAGKTSLLIDWLGARPESPAAWLSLDEYDNDPMQFWTAVVASLSAVPDSAIGGHSARLVGLARSDDRAFLDALGDVVGTESKRPMLVLDDYHVITTESIHAGLRLAVRHLSPALRLIVTTRKAPPLRLGRLRARGRLCEVRFDDLRFTVAESGELFERIGADRGDESSTRELVTATEGWAAALYVAAIGRQRAAAAERPETADPTRQHLSDYIVEEVLANEPEDRQRFLLETSILDPLTPARCDAVTGRADSARTLRELERSSQFLRRQDQHGHWYRCHSLLRDLLTVEIAVRGFPVAELHRRASAAAAREADPVAAIHHALEGGDVDGAAGLIGDSWIDFTNRGRFTTVMGWVDRWLSIHRSDGVSVVDPTIFIVGAWTALYSGRLDAVEQWLGRAEAVPFDGPLLDGAGSPASAISIVRTSHRRRIGSIGEGLAASEVAAAVERDPRSPWRAVAQVGRGATLYWAGRPTEAREALEDAVATAKATGLIVPVIMGEGHLALLDRQEGATARASERAAAAVALAEERHLIGYDQAAAAHLALGLAQLDAVDLDAAADNLAVAHRLGAQGDERLMTGASLLALAELSYMRGDLDNAARKLDDARRLRDRCVDPGLLLDWLDATERRLEEGGASRMRAAELTPREKIVLRYLGSSLTVPAIARELHVSPNTVKSQVASIRFKLGVSSRAEAVRLGRERGLLP